MTSSLDKQNNIATDYFDLVETLPLRPIHSVSAHTKAVRMLKRLAQLEGMNRDQSDYFDVLAELVEAYERIRWSNDTAKVSVPTIIRSFLDDHEMTASDLGRMLGERTIGYKVLSGKRKLTTTQVKILAHHFRVSTDLFIS